jgi:hypothetical protein
VLKLGTVIVRNTRRIRLLFSSAYASPDLFRTLLARLSSARAVRGAVPGTQKINGGREQGLSIALAPR